MPADVVEIVSPEAAAASAEADAEVQLLSAEDILSADDITYKDVFVPAWKGHVRLRQLTAQESVEFMDSIQGEAKKNGPLLLLIKSAVDKQGNKMFTPAVLDKLKKKSMASVVLLQNEALKLNGLTEEEKKV
jgi:hypothetical protein